MKRSNTQKGFTLVELAIVMTIIGLLIGGILKGQELMENARVTATVAQVKAIEGAVTTFRDAYGAFPGDMVLASNRLQGCALPANNQRCNPFVSNANPLPAAGAAGDGVVGSRTWTPAAGAAAAAWATQLQGVQTLAAPTAVGDETYLFWQHLMMANLIGGVTDASVRADTAYAWGATHPAARLAGGFIVGSSNGNSGPLGNTQTGGFISGTVLALVADPRAAVTNAANVTYPITPGRAAQIDLKMDEGRGSVGFVQGFGVAATAAGGAGCFLNTPAPGTNTTYNESSNARSCGLLFRIQN